VEETLQIWHGFLGSRERSWVEHSTSVSDDHDLNLRERLSTLLILDESIAKPALLHAQPA